MPLPEFVYTTPACTFAQLIPLPWSSLEGPLIPGLRRTKFMKKQIVICMGSSCFSRGNDRNLEIIEEFIAEHKMENRIDLRGSRCEGKCDHGPILKIDDKVFSHTNKADILEILKDNLFTGD
jgi:NADH:ubiquinone oxidoreductase subunit E